jgi:hypothetical protein
MRCVVLLSCLAALCAAHSEYLPALLRSIDPVRFTRNIASRSLGAYFVSAVNLTGSGTNAECYWR